MEYRRCTLALLWIEGVRVDGASGEMVIVQHDGNDAPDWELILRVQEPMDLERRSYQLDLVATTGERLAGVALLVRSVEQTLVFRGSEIETVAEDDDT